MPNNSTTRFSNRVEDYVRYRPHYPTAIISFLQQNYDLDISKIIADVGAGTGISSELFLDAGYKVIAIEPNVEMRQKATELLGKRPGFTMQDGTAEATGLPDNSVDAVVAGQAFHWFDAEKSRAEFARVLKPGGIVALIWNERKTASRFETEYDELIKKHSIDYVQVDHRNIDEEHIGRFYHPQEFVLKVFANKQDFDLDGLIGRLSSSSYAPAKGTDGYQPMIDDLQVLFDKYQQDGVITINYDTKVYVGKV